MSLPLNQGSLIDIPILHLGLGKSGIALVLLSSLLGFIHGLNPFMGWLFGLLYSLRGNRLVEGLKAVAAVSTGHIISIVLVATPLAYFTMILGPQLAFVVGLISIIWASLNLSKPRFQVYLGLNIGMITLATWGFLSASLHAAAIPIYPLIIYCGVTARSIGLILIVHYISLILTMALITCIAYYSYNMYFRSRFQKLLLINYELVWNVIVIIVGFMLIIYALQSII